MVSVRQVRWYEEARRRVRGGTGGLAGVAMADTCDGEWLAPEACDVGQGGGGQKPP